MKKLSNINQEPSPEVGVDHTKTPEFKNWFGDWEHPKAFTSKAPGSVSHAFDHEAKKPMVLYHGTNNDFATFQAGRPTINSHTFGQYETKRHGIFATPNREFAHEFLDKDKPGSSIMPLHMSIHAPFNLDQGPDSEVDDLAQHGVNPRWVRSKQNAWELFDGDDGANFVRGLKSAGYDGAMLHELNAAGESVPTYVAFDPHQVKSAIGNQGSFSSENPDITKSVNTKKTLSKNVGYVAYPKLGVPGTYSAPMTLTPAQIPDRYKAMRLPESKNARGETIFSALKSKGIPGKKAKFSSNVIPGPNFTGDVAHESQHGIFAKVAQKHGTAFKDKLIDSTLAGLAPHERKVLQFIHTNKDQYAPNHHAEESIAYMHNYLLNAGHRDRVHKALNLSPQASRRLHNAAKSVWKKIRTHAQTLDFPTVQKHEIQFEGFETLEKRAVPVFPKIGVGDRRNEIAQINDPKQLKTKLRVQAHDNAKHQLAHGRPSDIASLHAQARQHADSQVSRAVQGTTNTMGAVSGTHGYALSGLLRPSRFGPSWRSDKENDSHGTKQHEEFHAQMNRIEAIHGPSARRNLASNLWNSLGDEHRHAIDYLQQHHAGRTYEERNPTMATEEKLARIFNHLNSPDTRAGFHEEQDRKTHELPNGDVIEPFSGKYYIPGMRKLSNKQDFDNTIKDAHKTLLAASEVANENWLNLGHIKFNQFHANPNMVKSEDIHDESIDHMLGYSHSMQLMCNAARFLSGNPTDEKALRDAMLMHDGDLKAAVLAAHGIEPSVKNVKALLGITRIQDLKKGLTDDIKYTIKAAHPEADLVAQEIQHDADEGRVQSIKLGGKHSTGSLLIRTNESKNWLIKPGSGKTSPALGAAEEKASQSERETAFYHIAEAVGLGHIVPQAELILVNDKQAAAIHMLPFSWRNLDSVKEDEPNVSRIALEPYRLSGDIFKWAILDYVLGNTDRHGQNLMVSPKEDGYKIALIDHGSAFAGASFNPGQDSESWVPYYLRAWTTHKWKDMNYQEKLKSLPRAPAAKEKEVFHWLLGINPDRIAGIMQRYGINANPSIARLNELKNCKEPIDLFIGKKWVL